MEKNIGIYYATRYGQTKRIAHFLGESFMNLGWEVYVTNLRDGGGVPEVENFSAVLVGAPVYMHGYPRKVRHFVEQNRLALMMIPSTGFFSTSLMATPGTPEAYAEALGPARHFLDEVSWTPDWIASFPGALNYAEYNPMMRWVMQGISRREKGPTDASKDYELTRWEEVTKFAQDFNEGAPQSPYRADAISLATRTLNEFVPEFEQRIVQQIAVRATPEEVRNAIETMQLADMPLAAILAKIRNLGRSLEDRDATFQQAAAGFGVVPIVTKQAHEICGGLVGQFWKREYGIRMLKNAEGFKAFAESAYTKAITNFWFDEYRDGRTTVRTETRVHSLGNKSRRRFHGYWSMMSLGIRIYLASVLRGVARSVFRHNREQHVLAA